MWLSNWKGLRKVPVALFIAVMVVAGAVLFSAESQILHAQHLTPVGADSVEIELKGKTLYTTGGLYIMYKCGEAIFIIASILNVLVLVARNTGDQARGGEQPHD